MSGVSCGRVCGRAFDPARCGQLWRLGFMRALVLWHGLGSAASGRPFELGGDLIYFFYGLFSGRTGAETLRSMASGSAAIREKGWRW